MTGQGFFASLGEAIDDFVDELLPDQEATTTESESRPEDFGQKLIKQFGLEDVAREIFADLKAESINETAEEDQVAESEDSETDTKEQAEPSSSSVQDPLSKWFEQMIEGRDVSSNEVIKILLRRPPSSKTRKTESPSDIARKILRDSGLQEMSDDIHEVFRDLRAEFFGEVADVADAEDSEPEVQQPQDQHTTVGVSFSAQKEWHLDMASNPADAALVSTSGLMLLLGDLVADPTSRRALKVILELMRESAKNIDQQMEDLNDRIQSSDMTQVLDGFIDWASGGPVPKQHETSDGVQLLQARLATLDRATDELCDALFAVWTDDAEPEYFDDVVRDLSVARLLGRNVDSIVDDEREALRKIHEDLL